jgi:hypothetical protein
MASWHEIEADAPDFARRVRERFASGTNKTIATLRRDGSPRITAIECEFENGEVSMGMMGRSMKLLDVRRDPRIALHSPTIEPPKDASKWLGDAKLAGVLVEIPEPPDNPHEGAGFFKLDVREVALTYVTGDPPDTLVVESWHPGRGHVRFERD